MAYKSCTTEMSSVYIYLSSVVICAALVLTTLNYVGYTDNFTQKTLLVLYMQHNMTC